MVRELTPEKREKFLSEALRLFVENGVQGTSTAEIAKSAGTAAGTLFLYFPTKQRLVDELVLRIGREQAENIQSAITPGCSARDCFWSIWRSSVGWFVDHPQAFRFIQQVRDTSLISPAVTEESYQFFRFYFEAIQKGLAESSIKAQVVELIGGFLYADIVATTSILIAQPAASSNPDEIIRQGFEIFWDGIRVPSRE